MDISAVIGELDGLAASAATALAFGGAFGPARSQHLELLKASQQLGCEKRASHGKEVPARADISADLGP
jgi:hypothetical protein